MNAYLPLVLLCGQTCGGLVARTNLSQWTWSKLASRPSQSSDLSLAYSLRNARSMSLKGTLNMKTLVSFLLGTAMLFGAATFGLQSGSANARDRHDRKWRNERMRHHRHHRHRRHYRNKLSY